MISRASFGVTVVSLILLSAARLCPQISKPSEMIAPHSKLFYLTTSSDFAVLGKVVESRGVGKRLSREQLSKLDDLSKTLGGTLYTLRVEEFVIQRADLMVGGPHPQLMSGEILVFKKRDGPYSPNELYVKGERYLIFLSTPDQEMLDSQYLLDTGATYYQAFDPDDGIVRISGAREPFLMKLRQLGNAIRPSDPRQKMQRLKVLSRSRDPEIRDNANEAIKLIKQNHRK